MTPEAAAAVNPWLNPTVIAAFTTAIVAIIAAIAGAAVKIIGAIRDVEAKADTAIQQNVEIAHTASVAATATQNIRQGQVEIKQQTDGQLSAALADRDHWREVATLLMAMKSAEEGRPITAVSQVVRADDPLLKRAGNEALPKRRVTDPKPPDPS